MPLASDSSFHAFGTGSRTISAAIPVVLRQTTRFSSVRSARSLVQAFGKGLLQLITVGTRSVPLVYIRAARSETTVSLQALFEWLAQSSWSVRLHQSHYAYPLIESIHVWCMSVFFGLAMLFDLRLLGWTMRRVPVSEMSRRLLPWTVLAFALMVASGSLLLYAIPLRTYQNLFFRTKMLLLALAGLNVWIFNSKVYCRVGAWELARRPPRTARLAGGLSIVLWIGVIISGRMIAYNWFDCDTNPPPIVRSLEGCKVTPSSGN